MDIPLIVIPTTLLRLKLAKENIILYTLFITLFVVIMYAFVSNITEANYLRKLPGDTPKKFKVYRLQFWSVILPFTFFLGVFIGAQWFYMVPLAILFLFYIVAQSLDSSKAKIEMA